MKSLQTTFAVLAVVAMALTSCRKGEDDPFISFRSRDARITGEFEAEYENTITKTISNQYMDEHFSGSVAIAMKFGASDFSSALTFNQAYIEYNELAIFNPNHLIEAELDEETSENSTITYNGSASTFVTIDKDGTYEFTYSQKVTSYTINDNGVIETVEASTPFTNSGTESGRWNWDNSKKNKSGITFISDDPNALLQGTFSISQLKEKEVIMEKSFSTSSSTSEEEYSQGSSMSGVAKLVLTKKD